MKFLTLPMWPLKNVELVKDVGMIPYTLFKYYNVDAEIIVFIDRKKSAEDVLKKELVYFRNEVNGMKPVFIKAKRVNSKIQLLFKSIPPYAIAAGVPAKVIRYRFDKDDVDFLQRLKWWDKNEEEIKELSAIMVS